MIPARQWRQKDWARARALLASVLEGVGQRQQVEEVLEKSLQIRRLATAEEQKVIGPTKDVRPRR